MKDCIETALALSEFDNIVYIVDKDRIIIAEDYKDEYGPITKKFFGGEAILNL